MTILEKEVERKNILFILKNTRKALRTEDVLLLRDMSNRTVHSSSVYKDPTSIVIAVVIYSLSKIIERRDYRKHRSWHPFFSKVCKAVDRAIVHVNRKQIKEFNQDLQDMIKAVNFLSGRLKPYIKDVFRRAQINKASRIYEHGISRTETARLLGITQFELAEYIGKTGIADVDLSLTKSIKQRIQIAQDLFR